MPFGWVLFFLLIPVFQNLVKRLMRPKPPHQSFTFRVESGTPEEFSQSLQEYVNSLRN